MAHTVLLLVGVHCLFNDRPGWGLLFVIVALCG